MNDQIKEAMGPHVEGSVVWVGDNDGVNVIMSITEGVVFDRELRGFE